MFKQKYKIKCYSEPNSIMNVYGWSGTYRKTFGKKLTNTV